MAEKFIKINDGIYVVTDGNFKILQGHFTEEELEKIYQLAQQIDDAKDEKKRCEKELAEVQIMKNNAKMAWTMRIMSPLVCVISLASTWNSLNPIGTIFLLTGCTGLQVLVEKGIKMICGTKKEREEREQNAKEALKTLKHDLKDYEKELAERKSKTQYKEIPYEGDIIAEPVLEQLDNTPETIENKPKSSNEAFDWTQHIGRNSIESIIDGETTFTDEVLHPEGFEIPQTEKGPVLEKKHNPKFDKKN